MSVCKQVSDRVSVSVCECVSHNLVFIYNTMIETAYSVSEYVQI